MKVTATETKKGKTRKARLGKIKPFEGVYKEGELLMNFSYGSDTKKDKDGNEITVYLWVSGDWNVEYKGKEYLIPMSENVSALIEWINSQGKK